MLYNKLLDYAEHSSEEEPPLLQALVQETHATVANSHMLCGRTVGRLLKLLIKATQAKRVFEIGTYTGYSALSMAETLPSEGRVITCDTSDVSCHVARKYFEKSAHGHKIEFHQEEALRVLERISKPLDFAFIDGNKGAYPIYLDALLPKMRSGGMMVFDNTLWQGKVLSPQDDATRGIVLLNQRLKDDPSLCNVLLPIRDGVHVAIKL
jgi:caffeoyl-CoA O-methyltransferase